MTTDARLAALLRAGRSGEGGGAFNHMIIDQQVAAALRDLARALGLAPRLSQEEMARVLAGRLVRHKLSAWLRSNQYGLRDATLATAGLTYLPWIPLGYELPPEGFLQTGSLLNRPGEPDDDEADARLARVIARIMAESTSEKESLSRINQVVDNEVSESSVRGYQEGGRQVGREGYRRRINPDACQLCFWLWKGGYVYPVDQPMHRHIGCRCYPEYTTDRIGWKDRTQVERDEEAAFLEIYPSKGSPGYNQWKRLSREQRNERATQWRDDIIAGRNRRNPGTA